MKTTIISISTFFFLLFNALAQQPDYPQLRTEAEAQYAQGSYARANELYSRVDKSKLSAVRHTLGRVSFSRYRMARAVCNANFRHTRATSRRKNNSKNSSALSIRKPIAISCGPKLRNHSAILSGRAAARINWGGAWPRYQQALDWWAGQRDLERARARYLKIIFKAANPPRADQYYYTSYGNYIPLDVLENALKISTTANDKAHLNFLIAMTMRYTGGDMSARQRVPDQFEDALAAGKQTEWYDDALFHYAEWMNNYGSYRSLEDGQWQQRPDYVKALELYRRLITEFSKGETRYYDQAHVPDKTDH